MASNKKPKLSSSERKLFALRKRMDAYDRALCRLLCKRQALTKKIIGFKKSVGLGSKDLSREKLIVQNLESAFPKLDPAVIRKIYAVILKAGHQKT